jgi:hypothetical protein
MLLLVSVSDLIDITISPSVTLDIHCSMMDASGTVITPGSQNSATTVETTKTIVSSPGSGIERSVETIHIRNRHASTSSVITVRHTDGVTTVELFKATLLAGECLSYTEVKGFQLHDSDGVVKE